MDSTYRPLDWDQYIGQEQLKEHLRIKIAGAIDRCESLPHVLLVGTPGCGKTTIAALIAQELDAEFLSYVMPIKPNVLKKIVQQFEGVVFLDEIHRIPSKQEEDLLPLLGEGYLSLNNGARIYSGNLTIVGATTKPKKIDGALRDRFTIRPPFDPYTDEEMGLIVQGMANKLNMDMPMDVAVALGRATGGVPRNAEALVGMAQDLGSFDVKEILSKCRLTADGLSEKHLQYMKVLADASNGVGVSVLAAYLQVTNQDVVELEDLLITRGFIEHTKQGRQLTGSGYKALGMKVSF